MISPAFVSDTFRQISQNDQLFPFFAAAIRGAAEADSFGSNSSTVRACLAALAGIAEVITTEQALATEVASGLSFRDFKELAAADGARRSFNDVQRKIEALRQAINELGDIAAK